MSNLTTDIDNLTKDMSNITTLQTSITSDYTNIIADQTKRSSKCANVFRKLFPKEAKKIYNPNLKE
ncbi:MAG: hypothetical protein GY940_25040, partial [bacterium]|nr:hypothetical protein [bacterium]